MALRWSCSAISTTRSRWPPTWTQPTSLFYCTAGETSPAVQRRRVLDRLRRAADLAAKQGSRLVIELMNALPGMLLCSFADSVGFVREANYSGIKLVFDTGHVVLMREPML